MLPELHINYLAVAACVLVSMPLGFAWFGPLFGVAWAKEMGFDDMPKPDGKAMGKSLSLYALGSLLLAFVLAHSIEIWRPSTWHAGTDSADWVYGVNAAFWNWLGFIIPMQIGRVAWEFKGWKLVVINSSYYLTLLMIFGMILSYWR